MLFDLQLFISRIILNIYVGKLSLLQWSVTDYNKLNYGCHQFSISSFLLHNVIGYKSEQCNFVYSLHCYINCYLDDQHLSIILYPEIKIYLLPLDYKNRPSGWNFLSIGKRTCIFFFLWFVVSIVFLQHVMLCAVALLIYCWSRAFFIKCCFTKFVQVFNG
jgi:hypothetical protein